MQRREFLAASVASSMAAPALLAAEHSPGRIRIGQIGAGHGHAAGKLSALRKLTDRFDVVGVVEPNAEQRARVENTSAYAGLRWITEEELLATPGLKAVAVETEVRDLVPTAARCVAAGMHVHLDKPAGESLTRFRELLDAAKEKGVIVQMGYMFRSNPAFQFLYRAVREGWLGSVFEVHAVMSKQLGPEERKELAVYPGGSPCSSWAAT